MICQYASSGCNGPKEGECMGLCMERTNTQTHIADNFALAKWMDQRLHRWVIFYFVLLVAILALLGCDDHGYEQAIAADMEQAQREETRKADRVVKQISDCVAERGPGAVPVFDEQGFVTRCVQRRKS